MSTAFRVGCTFHGASSSDDPTIMWWQAWRDHHRTRRWREAATWLHEEQVDHICAWVHRGMMTQAVLSPDHPPVTVCFSTAILLIQHVPDAVAFRLRWAQFPIVPWPLPERLVAADAARPGAQRLT